MRKTQISTGCSPPRSTAIRQNPRPLGRGASLALFMLFIKSNAQLNRPPNQERPIGGGEFGCLCLSCYWAWANHLRFNPGTPNCLPFKLVLSVRCYFRLCQVSLFFSLDSGTFFVASTISLNVVSFRLTFLGKIFVVYSKIQALSPG